MQTRRAVFKAEVILLAAIKVDSEILQTRLVFPGQNENTVMLSVRQADGLAESGPHQSGQWCAGMSRG